MGSNIRGSGLIPKLYNSQPQSLNPFAGCLAAFALLGSRRKGLRRVVVPKRMEGRRGVGHKGWGVGSRAHSLRFRVQG